MADSQNSSGTDQSSENQVESGKNNPPLFQNRENAVAGWIDRDMNGDYYVRLSLPMGLGTVPVFLNDSQYEELQEEFNELVEEQVEN